MTFVRDLPQQHETVIVKQLSVDVLSVTIKIRTPLCWDPEQVVNTTLVWTESLLSEQVRKPRGRKKINML